MEKLYECGYCLGRVVYNEKVGSYVHADDGQRVNGPQGDYVTEQHNHAGTLVLIADVVNAEE